MNITGIIRPHIWQPDGDAKRCRDCGMRSTWAGALAACTGYRPEEPAKQNARQRMHRRKRGARPKRAISPSLTVPGRAEQSE